VRVVGERTPNTVPWIVGLSSLKGAVLQWRFTCACAELTRGAEVDIRLEVLVLEVEGLG